MSAINLNKNLWIIVLIIFLFLGLVFSLFLFFYDLSLGIIVSLILVGLFKYPVEYFENKGFSRKQSFFLVNIFFLIIILSMILFFSRYISYQFWTLTEIIPGDFEILGHKISQILNLFSLQLSEEIIINYLNDLNNLVVSQILFFGSTLLSSLIYIFLLVPIITTIITFEGGVIKKNFFELVPNKYFEMVLTSYNEIVSEVSQFITAKIVEIILMSFVIVMGFLIIGLEGAIILGIFAGILNFIPYLGPVLGAILPLLLAFLHEDPLIIFGVLIVLSIAQLIDNLYIIPILISKMVHIHPITAVIVILVGGQILGPAGMIIATPLYSVVRIISIETYKILNHLYPSRYEEIEMASDL